MKHYIPLRVHIIILGKGKFNNFFQIDINVYIYFTISIFSKKWNITYVHIIVLGIRQFFNIVVIHSLFSSSEYNNMKHVLFQNDDIHFKSRLFFGFCYVMSVGCSSYTNDENVEIYLFISTMIQFVLLHNNLEHKIFPDIKLQAVKS